VGIGQLWLYGGRSVYANCFFGDLLNSDKYTKLFNSRVRQLMGERRPSWLAKQSGLAASSIGRLLDGEMSPNLESLVAIALALGVTPASLIEDSSAPKKVSVERTVRLEQDAVVAIREEIRAAISSPDDLMIDVA